ncbi:Protein NEOXANTHIN-DEFICIENT like [Actinidia chinensis var. chinensis]|uniref:Protein NEOXANTHIN-DEFICIENT like n=1 Tax=Actinidia chinensis var. chinensis TaxID=1590841 RepID=A0A2R6REM7_ACTCC|nr:Protein NEOXANTHIN-DEFICIENT like [Actinidia chinensis var. chinensis]
MFIFDTAISCRIRAVQPAKVSGPPADPNNDTEPPSESRSSSFVDSVARELGENERNLGISVMLSKPILALEFSCLKMQVEAPIIVSSHSNNTSKGS